MSSLPEVKGGGLYNWFCTNMARRSSFVSFSRQILSFWVSPGRMAHARETSCLCRLTASFPPREPLVLGGTRPPLCFAVDDSEGSSSPCSHPEMLLCCRHIHFLAPHQESSPQQGPIWDCCHLTKQEGAWGLITPWHQLNATVVTTVVTGGIFVSRMELS